MGGSLGKERAVDGKLKSRLVWPYVTKTGFYFNNEIVLSHMDIKSRKS